MKKQLRKTYSAEFKVKVVLEAFKGQCTINEISSHYEIHPNQVNQWKKQAAEGLPDVFSTRRVRIAEEDEARTAQLYQQIGQLKVELDWLKKSGRVLLNKNASWLRLRMSPSACNANAHCWAWRAPVTITSPSARAQPTCI